MLSAKSRIHGALIVAGGLFGVSLSVLILGASRGQATDAGLPGSAATPFSLRDNAGAAHGLADFKNQPVVLVVAQHDNKDFSKSADEINQVVDTFAKDADVKVVGVQVAADAGLLAASAHTPGSLETRCPQLSVLQDADGSVARAYRVMDTPTAFVIDSGGVIRARVGLDHDGAAVSIAGTVSSLRPMKPGDIGLSMGR